MTIFSMEQLAGTLLGYGFEFVDANLFNLVLAKISTVQSEKNDVKINDKEYSSYLFNKYITIENSSFILKDGYNLETDIGDGEYYYSLGQALRNKSLCELIDNIDFEKIIIRKAELLGIDSFQEIQSHPLFSNKEKELMKSLDEVLIYKIKTTHQIRSFH